MSDRFDFEFGFSRPQADHAPSRADDAPTRILFLGNLSGRQSGDPSPGPISARTLHALDLDTFDGVLARMRPRVRLEPAGGADVDLEIGSMDSFHPDTLYDRLPAILALREMRERGPEAAATVDEPAAREGDGSTLERLLGRPDGAETPATRSSGSAGGDPTGMGDFIRNLVAPHVVPDPDPKVDAFAAAIDAAIQDQLRVTLHAPAFQALEATWRGLDWLRTELELDEDLQLFVCDLTQEELLADLREHADRLEDSEFYRLVYEQELGTAGGRAWSLLLGDFYLGTSDDDVFMLAALGAIAARAGAPLVAGARMNVLGCSSLVDAQDPKSWGEDDLDGHERWAGLRRSAQAPWLGLALPRVLMRLPYGSGADTVESLPFEELAAEPDHDSFLWGNPALACALHVVRRKMGQAGSETIADLPAYVCGQGDARALKPGAEVLLSERAGRAILDHGVMPILSHRDRNAVTILRVQSLADPPCSLQQL